MRRIGFALNIKFIKFIKFSFSLSLLLGSQVCWRPQGRKGVF